ncbi:MAG: hypothetical protein ACRD1T_11610 [Acidimicrobiia bacterium]
MYGLFGATGEAATSTTLGAVRVGHGKLTDAGRTRGVQSLAMFDNDRYNELLAKVPELGFRELIDIRHAIKKFLGTMPHDGPKEILTEASDAGRWLGDNLYNWASSQIENPDLQRTDTEADELSVLQSKFALAVARAEKATRQAFVQTE